jgi:hypothetical protein
MAIQEYQPKLEQKRSSIEEEIEKTMFTKKNERTKTNKTIFQEIFKNQEIESEENDNYSLNYSEDQENPWEYSDENIEEEQNYGEFK